MEIRGRVLGPEHPDTLTCMHDLAVSISRQGRYEDAEKLYRELLEIKRRSLGEAHPETLEAVRDLARLHTNWCWKLATAADASLRDPAKALALANSAIELLPDVANHWSNLGVAQYRVGNWQAAVEALEKADAMIEGGDRGHRMFLAMAHWQLGNKEKAWKLYAEGAAWIAEQRKNSEQQKRFRAEVEVLMEITEEDRKRLVKECLKQGVDNAAVGTNGQIDEEDPEKEGRRPQSPKPEAVGTDS
jgi:tetratricopeptide (TPR) repeat protein